jgi:hypothetical protein
MAARKRKAPRKKLSTKFKQNPISTTKAEFNKLGPIAKGVVLATVAGATSIQAARALDGLPVIGPFFSVFTTWGASLRRPRA